MIGAPRFLTGLFRSIDSEIQEVGNILDILFIMSRTIDWPSPDDYVYLERASKSCKSLQHLENAIYLF